MCNSKKVVKRRHRSGPRVLVEPTVVGLLEGGLLPTALQSNPVPVTFPVWDDAIDNDFYQLKWDDTLIGEQAMLPGNPAPGTPLALEIPVDVLNTAPDGEHKLSYISRRFVGGTPNESPAVTVILDRVQPGAGSLIAPLIFPRLVNDGLSSAELTAMGDVLLGEVVAYFGIQAGDVIQTFWGETQGPQHTVKTNEVPGGGTAPQRIMIPFTRAFLESLGDVNEDVYYTLVDRAGNGPVQSEPVSFQLSLKEPALDLPAPIIDQADDGVISETDARMTVEVDIPDYGDVQVGDLVTLYWGANSLAPIPVEAGDETENPIFTVPVSYGTIALTPDGNVDVRYEVQRSGALLGSSQVKTVSVLLQLPGPVEPAAPIIRGGSDNPDSTDNVIDENDYLLPATALIPWKAGYMLGDEVKLFWGHQATPVTYVIKASDISAGLDLLLTVPNALIIGEGTGQDIRVYYAVTRAGNPNTLTSPQQSVQVRRLGELPGGEDGLKAPQFLRLTDQNGIGAILNPDGASVVVAPYLNIKAGDVLTFNFLGWSGFVSGPQIPEASYTFITEPLTEEQITQDYEFTVPDANLRLICVGRAEATFKVDSISGPATSAPAKVLIDMVTPGEGCEKH
ncbi:addiction module component [Pseudomonas sp. DWP3-1-2]|uniref:addiction module component n=1 Tax=Pseudomonas sp. DWP3-1-2 TaxID=2804645 RepID=UPI003CEBC377